MNIFIIPSWYPSESHPTVGIFFHEQARLMAQARPDWNIGVSIWGSHEPKLWVHRSTPLDSLIKLGSKPALKPYDNLVETNCVEFFTPAYTWTRSILKGNMKGIGHANKRNFERFEAHFGPIDIVHAHVSYPAGAIAKELSGLKKLPYLITEHMSPFPMPSFKRSTSKYLIPPLKSASAVLSVGQKLSQELSSFGINSRRINNFVDLEQFKVSDFTSEVPEIFALGRLEPQKNFQVLINSLAYLKDKPWKLSIGGDGTELKRLKKLVLKHGLEGRISFLGTLDQTEVAYQMKHSSFLVMPSLHESFGVVALEAMACGKPVIVTKSGGIDEQIPEDVGLVVELTEEALIRGLSQMIENYHSYDVDHIRSFVEKTFSPAQVCSQLEEIYNEILTQ
ncbi:MAG: glycosyltransferase [Marinoscillum sp.]